MDEKEKRKSKEREASRTRRKKERSGRGAALVLALCIVAGAVLLSTLWAYLRDRAGEKREGAAGSGTESESKPAFREKETGPADPAPEEKEKESGSTPETDRESGSTDIRVVLQDVFGTRELDVRLETGKAPGGAWVGEAEEKERRGE